MIKILKIFLIFILGVFILLGASTYFIYSNIQKIENEIESIYSFNLDFGKIQLTSKSILLKNFTFSNENIYIIAKDIELPFKFKRDLFNLENYQIRSINIGDVFINTHTNSDSNNIEFYKSYLNKINNIDIIIKNISINNNNYSNLKLKLNQELVNFSIEQHNNSILYNGVFNLYSYLENNIIKLNTKITLNNFNISQLNQFQKFSAITSGDIFLNIDDSKKNINGRLSISDFGFILNKKYTVKPFNIELLNNDNDLKIINKEPIFIDNEKFNISQLIINTNNFQSIEKITFKDNNQIHTFIFHPQHYEYLFNELDSKYLVFFDAINIQEKFKLKNGSLIFNQDKILSLNSNIELNVDKNKLFSSIQYKNNELLFNNFSYKNKAQKGFIKYETQSEIFEIDLLFNIDSNLYNKITKNINFLPTVKNFTGNINTNLKISDKQKKYNLILNLNNNTIYIDNYTIFGAKGLLTFSNNQVTSKIVAAKLSDTKDTYKNIYLNTIINDSSKELNFDLGFIKAKYKDNKVNSIIDLDIAHIDILKSFHILKSYNLDKKQSSEPFKNINIFVQSLNFNKHTINSVQMHFDHIGNNYNILTKIKDPTLSVEIISSLSNLTHLESDFKIKITDPLSFSKKHNLLPIIKNSEINIDGNIQHSLLFEDREKFLSSINGNINFYSKNGEFVNVNMGSGVLLNIFNFRTIPDLITLDTQNIFNKKSTYDQIKSSIYINNGILNFKNFEIKSKISEAKLYGNVNLLDSELNLQFHLTPKVTNSALFTTISIASGFNPITMLGTTLLEKLIPIPNFTYIYNINGKISDPKIEYSKN